VSESVSDESVEYVLGVTHESVEYVLGVTQFGLHNRAIYHTH